MRLFSFLGSVCDEMKKVVWPGAKQTKQDTEIVIMTSVIFAILFAIVDSLLQWGIGLI